MFTDARRVPDGSVVETDVCIVGAGAAGITLAREFNGQRFRVALLESGGFDFDAETQSLYKGRTTGIPYFKLDEARLRFFGGTTNHWGGLCRPFDPIDFEPRPGVPWTGWPIRRSDLDGFYPRAAQIVHLTASNWSIRYWSRRDNSSPISTGRRVLSRLVQIVPPVFRSFGTTYRSEIDRSRNVVSYLHANVTEIDTDEAARTATHVRVATLSGTRFSVAARLFIVAVGGIENPRLLLASNRTQRSGLGNQHDLVGRFFLEHPRFRAGVLVPLEENLSTRFYEPHRAGKGEIEGYLAPTDDVKQSERLVDVQIRLDPLTSDVFAPRDIAALRGLLGTGSPTDEHIEGFGRQVELIARDLGTWHRFVVPGSLLPVPYPDVLGKLARSSRLERRALIPALFGDIAAFSYEKVSGRPLTAGIGLTTRISPAPNPDSRVTLMSTRDRIGMPRAQLNWELSPIDRRSVIRTLEIFGAAVGAAGIGRVRIVFDEDARSWPTDTAGGWHHMGTTRMSDNPKLGVVDANCKVHGTTNLFIAGSSVFATGGSGTPTLTLVALALRLAGHVKRIMA